MFQLQNVVYQMTLASNHQFIFLSPGTNPQDLNSPVLNNTHKQSDS